VDAANTLGLVERKELVDYFNSIGTYHPDDMSGIILTSYYRETFSRQEWKEISSKVLSRLEESNATTSTDFQYRQLPIKKLIQAKTRFLQQAHLNRKNPMD